MRVAKFRNEWTLEGWDQALTDISRTLGFSDGIYYTHLLSENPRDVAKRLRKAAESLAAEELNREP